MKSTGKDVRTVPRSPVHRPGAAARFVAGAGLLASFAAAQGLPVAPVRHILFVGDSFTHGRYLPVRAYHNTPLTGGAGSTVASAYVVDENFRTPVPQRAEDRAGEAGPWGGVPGIFAELAAEAGLAYDVHIEAISATTLARHYDVARDVIASPLWTTVVLQEATFEPVAPALSHNSRSRPAAFCASVRRIEEAVHAAAPAAGLYLYETGAPADTAYTDSAAHGFSAAAYLSALQALSDAYHDAYLTAAARDGHVAGVAATGDAWALAWAQGVADPDPYRGDPAAPSLTFNQQAGSSPSTGARPTDAGFHHPSIYGAYLNGLVLFEKITAFDVRAFGGAEGAARSLGIPSPVAVQLQQVAWESVTRQNTQLIHPAADACE